MTSASPWGVRVAADDAKSRAAASRLALLVAVGEASTRAALARTTTWAPSTVSRHVDLLLDARVLVERAAAASSGGRPAVQLGLNPAIGLLLTLQVGTETTTLAVADFAGEVLATDVSAHPGEGRPDAVLTDAAGRLEALREDAGLADLPVLGVAVGLPCPVDHRTGRIVRPPRMPGWDRFDVGAEVRVRFGAEALVDNDANLMASGEAWARRATDQHVLVVELGASIGAGIVTGGAVHRGEDGTAGEIGHLSLAGHDDELCQCGKTGCLEAVASGWALVRKLRAAGLEVDRTSDVVRMAAEGDPVARRAVDVAAAHIGEVLASVVSFYNPTSIVLGGELAALEAELLAGIRSVVYRRALPSATRTVRIEASTLGRRAAAIGGTMLLRARLLSPDGIRLPLLAGLDAVAPAAPVRTRRRAG